MNKKKMATQISDSHIDELYETARKHGALGGKISGAGGGVYMFFYCNSNRKHILAEQLERLGTQVVDFNFDFRGLQTWDVKEATPARLLPKRLFAAPSEKASRSRLTF